MQISCMTMSKLRLRILPLVTHFILFMITVDSCLSGTVHYVIPSPTTQCPGKSCLTLSTLSTNTSDYLDSNTTFVFLEGRHTLDSELVVSNINGSLMLSSDGSRTATSIGCKASLKFLKINQLKIRGLEFIGCSSNVRLVDQFTLEDSRFYSASKSSALHLFRIRTDARIIRSSFVLNTAGTYQSHIEVLAYYRYNSDPYPRPDIQTTSAKVGGAIIVTSSIVDISGSHFESNTAKVGGAIFSHKGSNITISNCTFVNNSAASCSDDGCHGGSLFIDSGCTVTAHNSTFMNNTAGYAGGAIAIFQGTLLDSTHNVISGNRAGGLGGAIFAYNKSRITIYNSHYRNNTGRHGEAVCVYGDGSITMSNSYNNAGRSGGVLYAYSSSITVGNSSFDNNEAHRGGVMYAWSGSITVGKSSFDNNEAGSKGGVMYAWSSSNITVGDSSYDNNEAGYDGGVMSVSSSSITVGNSSFNNNEAGSYGGVMSAQSSSNITVDNSSFSNNEAGIDGGVVYTRTSGITVNNSSFDKNVARRNGGDVHTWLSRIIVSYSSFCSNEAGNHGGVMDAQSSSNITVGDSSFDNNEAGYDGGVMSVSSSSITVGNSSFNNNEAGSYGGVMSAQSSSNITVDNSSFNNNEAGIDGGVVYTRTSGITVNNSSFDKNVARRNGGDVHTWLSRIIVSYSSFCSNEAGNRGGVMDAQSSSNITVGDSSFDNNEAGYDGGVMSVSSSSITVGNSSFNNNEAGSYGGVMSAQSSSNITVDNSSFNNNEACIDGGVVYTRTSGITVNNSSFDKNVARRNGGDVHTWLSRIIVSYSSFCSNEAGNRGGVMHAQSSSNITVGDSSFDNNEAGSDGGVMNAWSSSITVGNSSFDNNEAGNNGGVMSAQSSSNITVDNSSSFDNNEAGKNGGVMYARSSNITVDNSSFNNNEAGNNGGVMYARSSNITVDNSFFDNNEAGFDGGVVYITRTSGITVNNSSFDKNVARRNGGDVYALFSRIIVSYSSFCSNKGGNSGGVMYSWSSSSITVDNSFFDNNEASNGGGVIYIHNSSFKDQGSRFQKNSAGNGGVIILDEGTVKTMASDFVNNTAATIGGILYVSNYAIKHHITFAECNFDGNEANSGGVVALSTNNNLTVMECSFSHNSAVRGGVIYLTLANMLTIKYSDFSYNSAISDGGVIYSTDKNTLMIDGCAFKLNSADNNGGVLYSPSQTDLKIVGGNSTFAGNQGHRGGVVYASESRITVYGQGVLMANNTAVEDGGAMYLSSANLSFFGEHNILIGNAADSGGAIFAAESHIKFSNGCSELVGNAADSGGAIFAAESRLIFSNASSKLIGNTAHSGGVIFLAEKSRLKFINGRCKLSGNQADYGGAIYTSESEVVIAGVNTWTKFNVSTNLAMHHGGGLYMTKSQLNFKGQNLYINENRANRKGGGIHANNSHITFEGEVHLTGNEAENGGAISLERNAKLMGGSDINDSIHLISNTAKLYGGALYVDDNVNSEICVGRNDATKTECFSKSVFLSFSDNSAGVSGTNLFGGLLDRCVVHNNYQKSNPRSETTELGRASFLNSSNIDETQLDTISSSPIQLCLCRDNQPDCNYVPEPIQFNRGKAFLLHLIAYNHISKPVRAAVALDLSNKRIAASKFVNNSCTEVEVQFNSSTPTDDFGSLTMSVVGPCNVPGISTKNIIVKFTPCTCPIGFQISTENEMSCDCVCNQVLQSYEKTECNPTTESIVRRENFWISYVNHTWSNSSGYVIYPHCPFDYCYTPDKPVSVNLNLPNGSDAQCDSNRMGTLCGTCKAGLSVSLGSSKCISCPYYWPGLLVTIVILFIISGIGLVAFLLALNLTVAIGTLNATIFYANIVAANKSALLSVGVSPASVFISWLNFDFGFDICFFDGMDMYVKTWLQLAFSAYIIILVVVIIQLSYYFTAFGHLVGKKDPVATLATLILLSYAKLLQTIILAFSSASLYYPDGSKKTLWLPEPTIEYFTSKHAVLFFTAILILLAGLIYTFLLLSWQWFLLCPRKRAKWIRNQKLSSFIESYLIPYSPKHRYWTGLLLLVRVSVYLVSAFNPSGDPRVTLSATNFIMSSLFLYIATFGVRMYKNRFINAMETLTYFNIIALCIFTWYTIDADTNQTAVTNVSVGIVFIQLIAVILYHTYKHMNQKLFVRIQKSLICIKMKEKLTLKHQKQVNNHNPVPVDEDIHQFHMLLDMIDRPVNTNDYKIPQIQPKPVEPTQSVVEIPKPVQAAPASTPPPPPPPPLEAIKEEAEPEQLEEEDSQQDMIPVTESLAPGINKNKQCINNCPGMENLECDDASCTNPENDMEQSRTILTEEMPIPKCHSRLQINNDSDTKETLGVDSIGHDSSEFTGHSSTASRQ